MSSLISFKNKQNQSRFFKFDGIINNCRRHDQDQCKGNISIQLELNKPLMALHLQTLSSSHKNVFYAIK